MKPKSLSASAAQSFETCPARWLAESHHRTGKGGRAANLGTAVHNALEGWVKSGEYRDTSAGFNILEKMFEKEFYDILGLAPEEFKDGIDMLKDWYKRNHPFPDDIEVISTEVKSSFDLQTSIGPIPFNYIWDRCDRLPNGDIEVVDYKTIRMAIPADKMKELIQVRAYALAAAIEFKGQYDRIWMSYDMLRHGAPVGVSFTREENEQTWKYLHNLAERVIAMDETNPPERVNSNCRWCIRKAMCKSLARVKDMGGLDGVEDMGTIVARRAMFKNALDGMKNAIREMDDAILEHAGNEDMLEWEEGQTSVAIRARRMRNVDAETLRKMVPDDVWEDYGKKDITMGNFDKMLKDSRLDDDTRREVEQLVEVSIGQPYVKTEVLTDFDDD